MPSLTHNRVSLIALRMDEYAILCCLLSTSSRRSPIRLLKKGVKTNPDILDLFWNRIPNISHVPMSLKETVAVEQLLKSGLESHNFFTWSVVALICSLHEKKLLPMDDPVISQLQKSFSKACGSVASCLNFKCYLHHPEEETASPLPCGAFSLRRAGEELALGPVLPDKLSFLFFVC